MAIGTPFHSRTSTLCASQNWRTWSGYFAASSYDVVHDYEYHAIRSSAALIDVSPLFKYEVRGRDALNLVNRVVTRDAAKCAVGQAIYTCLCDDEGKVIQDGTVFRLAEDHFRFNLAEPSLRWLHLNAAGLEVKIEEVSEKIAALALQGPNSLRILQRLADVELGELKFFRLVFAKIGSIPAIVSRTGYTGDLGYEIWFSSEFAEPVWDGLMDAGKKFGIKPTGLLALDVARLEAGFILLDVDYMSVEKALTPLQRYTPFEIGLGWTVDLRKEFFLGCKNLRAESERGSSRQIVGLEIDMRDYEHLFHQYGLPPQIPLTVWRGGVPVYQNGQQAGHATTGGWSPLLKKYIALATLSKEYAEVGNRLEIEVTVQYARKTAGSAVVRLPFFDPPRKKALFASSNGL
jgi:glycine cleavage system T protein (aminomethyltransferase)